MNPLYKDIQVDCINIGTALTSLTQNELTTPLNSPTNN